VFSPERSHVDSRPRGLRAFAGHLTLDDARENFCRVS
jgi:hypothetical protein